MSEPTKEQTEWFWKLCGFYPKEDWKRKGFHYELGIKLPNWIYPDEQYWEYGEAFLPRIDIKNLFKYAVPKLRKLSETNTLQDIEFHWQGVNVSDEVECNLIFDDMEYSGTDTDEAIALFWAIWDVFNSEKPSGVLTNKG